MTAEAFIYLWYHGPTKRYYLGYHKGTPDDGYSHSSSVMESWNANNPPSGWRRRILAYGSVDQMIVLEDLLLRTRLSRGWFNKKYINLRVGKQLVFTNEIKQKISVAKKKFWDSKTPEERSALLLPARDATTTEMRTSNANKMNATLSEEQKRENGRRGKKLLENRWNSFDAEGLILEKKRLSQISKDSWIKMSEEQRYSRVKGLRETQLTTEQRSVNSKKRAQTLGNERLSEIIRKGHETRRRNKMQNTTPPLADLA